MPIPPPTRESASTSSRSGTGSLSRAPRPSFVTVPAEAAGVAVPDFLDHRFPRVGRQVWAERIRAGKVLGPDGRPLGAEAVLRGGERLAYFREVETEPRVPFREEVLLATEHFLVVDKPPFLPVVPAGPHVNECLLYRLVAATGREDLTPVHRLDKETAGLVLFSLRPESRGLYGGLFARGEVEREYRAVGRLTREPVGGPWRVASHLVAGEPWFRMRELPGGPDPTPNAVTPNAVTRIELLARQGAPGSAGSGGRGLFALHPETGKKHQLRIHMASLGFPIVGDRFYPELLPELPPDFTRPLSLLARRLAFRDPVSGERVEVESRQPLELAEPPRGPEDEAGREDKREEGREEDR